MSLLTLAKKLFGGVGKREQKPTPPRGEGEPAPKKPAAGGEGTLASAIGMLPLLTEKSVSSVGKPTVVFRVAIHATKGQIAQAVKQRYKVKPVAVRTMRLAGKRRRRGATEGRTAAWKKAYVTVPAGEAIDLGP